MWKKLNQIHLLAFQQSLHTLPGGQALVLELDQPIGFLVVYPTTDPKIVAVYDFCIHPDYQGKGYGKQLLIKLFDWCLNQQIEGIYLTIREGYPEADKLAEFYTQHFISAEVGNFIFMGRIRPSMSIFIWRKGKYVPSKESLIARKLSLYSLKLIKPVRWINAITEKIPWFE